MNVTWGDLEPTEGVSSNVWRTEREQHNVFIVQRHVLLTSRHRIVLKLPRKPLVCAVQSKEDAAKIEALLVQIYTAESMRVGSYRFSDSAFAPISCASTRQAAPARRVERKCRQCIHVVVVVVVKSSLSSSNSRVPPSLAAPPLGAPLLPQSTNSTTCESQSVNVVVFIQQRDREVPASIARTHAHRCLTYAHLRDVADQREFSRARQCVPPV
jgi:hypothetical protein